MKIEPNQDTFETTVVSDGARRALVWPGRKDDRDWWLYAPASPRSGCIAEPGKWCEDYLDALAHATAYVTTEPALP